MTLPETLFPWLVLIAAVNVFAVMMIVHRRAGVSSKAVEWFAVFAIPLGAFLGHLAFALAKSGEYMLQEGYGFAFLFTPWRGGFMFWGVVLGCFLAGLLACACVRYKKDQRRRLMDLIAVGLILLIALIRLAEPFDTVFDKSQGYGLYIEEGFPSFFPLAFSPEAEYPEDRYYAVFLAEALYAAAVFVWALAGMKKRHAGKTAAATLLLYAAGQIWFEYVRQDSVVALRFVRLSQVIAAGVLLLLLILAVGKRRISAGDFFLRLAGFALLACMIICMEFAGDGKNFELDADTLANPAVRVSEGILCAGLAAPLTAAVTGVGALGYSLAREPAYVDEYSGNLTYTFPLWQVFFIVFACALCMAFIVWRALYPPQSDRDPDPERLK